MYFEIRGEKFDLLFSRLFCLFGVLSGSTYIFLATCFFHFYENGINNLIGVAVNLYLAFSSVQMSTVVTLKSMSKICHFSSSCLVSLSQCGVHCVGRVLWRPCVPSPPLISESVVEGWVREETQCPSLPHFLSDDVQHRCPGPCVHTCLLKRNTCWEFLQDLCVDIAVSGS